MSDLLTQAAADAKAIFISDFAESCIAVPKGRASFSILAIVDRNPIEAQGPMLGQRVARQFEVEFVLADWGVLKPMADQIQIPRVVGGTELTEPMTITEEISTNFPGLVRYKLG